MKNMEHFDIIEKAALSGGDILKGHFNNNVRFRYKGTRNGYAVNPVSIADERSEKKIMGILRKYDPAVGFICEESCNDVKQKGGYNWIIDPLDGTVNYIYNVPVFCVSIALAKGEDVLAGTVYNPMTGEFFYAEKNRGAYLKGKKIHVSERKPLSKCMINTGFPYSAGNRYGWILERYRRFLHSVQSIRLFGAAALDLAHVACGQIDAFWEPDLKPWDMAAGSLLVKEAGGKVTNGSGNSSFLFGKDILASNARVHKEALKILK